MAENLNFTGLTPDELEQFLESIDQPKYRAGQIFSWIHGRVVQSFNQMTDLPAELRQQFENDCKLELPDILKIDDSGKTGSRKFLMELSDGGKVESVFLPEGKRRTVCISSQIGCPLACKFCATGKMGFIRNLTTAEIVAQLYAIKREIGGRITNVVFMGMGEPLLNYNSVIKAARLIHHESGLNIGARKITISTSGIASRIRQLADERQPFRLAFSLNATTDKVRNQLMPINLKHDLTACIDALQYYSSRMRQKVMVEYIQLPGLNDFKDDADRLIKIVRKLRAKLNIIPFNPIPNSTYRHPNQNELNQFYSIVEPAIETVTVRWSQGSDISAACGQLYAENEKRKRHLEDKTQQPA